MRLLAFLMSCPVRVFGNDQWQDALAWLASSDVAGGLTHRWLPEHSVLRGLVVQAHEFPGWENLGSFLRHLGFVLDHHRKVHRVALCAGGRLFMERAELLGALGQILLGGDGVAAVRQAVRPGRAAARMAARASACLRSARSVQAVAAFA